MFSQVAAVVVYILCGWFSKSYIANFVAIVLLLMFDFWIVSAHWLLTLRSSLCLGPWLFAQPYNSV